MREKHRKRGEEQKEIEDAEYIAVLRDIEPAGAKEISEAVGVSADVTNDRLEKLHREVNSPVARKKVGESFVWSLDAAGIDARAEIAAEEIRRRMGITDGQ